MPNRILKEGIRTSEKVATLSDAEFRLFILLLSAVDDFGRFPADARLVRSACYPYGKQNLAHIRKRLEKLSQNGVGLIYIYLADGKLWLEILQWEQRQRANPKFPNMSPKDREIAHKIVYDGQLPVNGGAVRGARSEERGTRSEGSCVEPKQDSTPVFIRVPLVDKTEFDVHDSLIVELQEAYPAVDIKGELRRLVIWNKSNPKRQKTRFGVRRHINTWMRRCQDKGGNWQDGRFEPKPEYIDPNNIDFNRDYNV